MRMRKRISVLIGRPVGLVDCEELESFECERDSGVGLVGSVVTGRKGL